MSSKPNPYKLPVYAQRERILAALEHNQVIVVESPTGSGKTTQLPLILHEAGYSQRGVIGVTQPRRIAALSVSDYIARQTGSVVPALVGYKLRFEDRTAPSTRIKIMTDGILLQELKGDPSLSQYSVIIVDEAHERSLNIDFILGLLKRVLDMRASFKVIISSATINAEVFSGYFNECPVVRIDTKMFPVSVIYDVPDKEAPSGALAAFGPGSSSGSLSPSGPAAGGRDARRVREAGRRDSPAAKEGARPQELKDEALLSKIGDIIERIVSDKRGGDILIFLAGEKQIKDCIAMLQTLPFRRRLMPLPLYSRLSKEEQELVFIPTPRGKIKVIVSTNIAETSVTIDGVTSVLDSGLAKLNYYNPTTYTSSLVEGSISKSSCNQRKGRAGRTKPGSCYRLYSKKDFDERPLYTTEEIFRTDLSEVVLRMAEIGITEFESFDFISPPPRSGILSAVETLFLLDALDADRTLSATGKLMVNFPLIPRHSRMIVEAIMRYPNVIEEVLIAASFLTGNSPFLLPQGEEIAARKAHHSFRDPLGDFVSYLKIFRAYEEAAKKDAFCEKHFLDSRIMSEIKNVKEQLALIVSAMGIPVSSGGPASGYLASVSRGLIQFVCTRTGRGVYRSLTAERILIHPGSVMFRESPRYIVAGEIVRTSRMYARSVSPLEKSWLGEISPALAESFGAPDGGASDGEDKFWGKRDFDGKSQDRKSQDKKAAGKKSKRDTSWQLTIGGRIFELGPWTGKKKIALIPWEDAARLAAPAQSAANQNYSGLRGKILYGNYEISPGENIPALLRLARFIDPVRDISASWPRKKNFDSFGGRGGLVGSLDYILKLARVKKDKRVLGFLALHTDGEARYWYKPGRSFQDALETSLASLEALADELAGEENPQLKTTVNAAYRKLTAIMEE
ncbi:MAG: ATP-dependent RNA helicase [Spirochaetales bacterium]|jgi:HrpA-like RNA helicase|nr:ATP-dependent RNA helicase [Spirochaetales bacterium]